MTLEVLAPITIKLDGLVTHFEPGQVFTVTLNQAQRLLERAPGRLRRITLPLDPVPPSGSIPPLLPGWVVSYRDRDGRLCGGCDDRDHGTVRECRWEGRAWAVHLTDRAAIPLSHVRSVGQTDEAGQIVAAWCVREHGFDGETGS